MGFITFKTYMVLKHTADRIVYDLASLPSKLTWFSNELSQLSEYAHRFITFKTYMVLKLSLPCVMPSRCFITFKTYMVLKRLLSY